MSNIKCNTCGVISYDCGKEGYKTAREIELEKQLDIAVKALETIIKACEMKITSWGINQVRPESIFIKSIQNKATKALTKIKELDI